MKYNIEINCFVSSNGKKEWKKMHPTGGLPYEYETFQEAVRMAEMCYPDNRDDVRIVKSK